MMELFNRMPVKALKDDVPEAIAKRIGDFMVANGYRFVFDRWHLQARPAHEPTREQQYREALERIADGFPESDEPAAAMANHASFALNRGGEHG